MKFWIKKENDADPDVEWKDSYILTLALYILDCQAYGIIWDVKKWFLFMKIYL